MARSRAGPWSRDKGTAFAALLLWSLLLLFACFTEFCFGRTEGAHRDAQRGRRGAGGRRQGGAGTRGGQMISRRAEEGERIQRSAAGRVWPEKGSASLVPL
eukprot:356675-Chlamydomonas_euryale.AAC.2